MKSPLCALLISLAVRACCPQDSAAVQILLEVCMPSSEEQQQLQPGSPAEGLLRGAGGRRGPEEAEPEGGLLSDLREVQCLICCSLHQMFIADPNIAKLVHFQVRAGRLVACARADSIYPFSPMGDDTCIVLKAGLCLLGYYYE
jgi:hypothetical protein